MIPDCPLVVEWQSHGMACGCYTFTCLSHTTYLIGVWLGEDQKTNAKHTRVQKRESMKPIWLQKLHRDPILTHHVQLE